MERIRIHNYCKLQGVLERIDWCHHYAALLLAYTDNPIEMVGMPIPLFVLRNMAYEDRIYSFGSTNQSILVECLKDISYIVMTTFPDQQCHKPKNMSSEIMFSVKDMHDLQRKLNELIRRQKVHKSTITTLQRTQTTLLNALEKIKKRLSVETTMKTLQNVYTDHEPGDTKLMSKLETCNSKMGLSLKEMKTMKSKFQTVLLEENKARKDMKELFVEIERYLKINIAGYITKTISSMAQILRKAFNKAGHKNLLYSLARLSKIESATLADEVLTICSHTYNFIVPCDFIIATGFQEKLPSCYMEKTGISSLNLVFGTCEDGKSTESCGDLNTGGAMLLANASINRHLKFNDRYVKINGKKVLEKKHGFLNGDGDTFKQKLTLMEGSIAFGWARKGYIGSKTWGFYPTTALVG